MTKELLPGILEITDIPEGAKNIHIGDYVLAWDDGSFEGADFVDVGRGYSILGTGTADKISEEEAKTIVMNHSLQEVDMDLKPIGEISYTYWAGKVACDTAKDCLNTLLASHSLNPKTTVILIDKK